MEKTITQQGHTRFALLTEAEFEAAKTVCFDNEIPCEYGERGTGRDEPRPWGLYVTLYTEPDAPGVALVEAAISNA